MKASILKSHSKNILRVKKFKRGVQFHTKFMEVDCSQTPSICEKSVFSKKTVPNWEKNENSGAKEAKIFGRDKHNNSKH